MGTTTADLASRVINDAAAAGLTISCAESLTGGLIGATLVGVPGASAVFRGGAITYATDTKASVLGISRGLLDDVGPVDGDVARAMAQGSARLFDADLAVAVTGVAGPGLSDGHEAGTVWIAVSNSRSGETWARLFSIAGDRDDVRQSTVSHALELLFGEISRINSA